MSCFSTLHSAHLEIFQRIISSWDLLSREMIYKVQIKSKYITLRVAVFSDCEYTPPKANMEPKHWWFGSMFLLFLPGGMLRFHAIVFWGVQFEYMVSPSTMRYVTKKNCYGGLVVPVWYSWPKLLSGHNRYNSQSKAKLGCKGILGS